MTKYYDQPVKGQLPIGNILNSQVNSLDVSLLSPKAQQKVVGASLVLQNNVFNSSLIQFTRIMFSKKWKVCTLI